jgi:hypothetical protein
MVLTFLSERAACWLGQRIAQEEFRRRHAHFWELWEPQSWPF